MSTLFVERLGNSTINVPVRNLTNNATHIWCSYDQITTSAIDNSFNVTSLTDTATGEADFDFSSNMANRTYSFCNGMQPSNATTSAYGLTTLRPGSIGFTAGDNKATDEVNVASSLNVTGANVDADDCGWTVQGYLA